MGKREKFIRAKLIDQLENFNELSEKIFSNEELKMEEVEKIDKALNNLEDTLAVYRFVRELRDSDEMQIEFLEMFDRYTEADEEPSKANDVVKSIEEFEEIIAEDVEIETSVSTEEWKTERPDEPVAEPESMTKGPDKEVLNLEKTDPKSVALNDRISSEPSLADRFQGNVVKSLKESVGLNDRFQFASELFHGNMEELKKTLNMLDQQVDFQHALKYLESECSSSQNWDQSSEAYQRFINLLKRRFPVN